MRKLQKIDDFLWFCYPPLTQYLKVPSSYEDGNLKTFLRGEYMNHRKSSIFTNFFNLSGLYLRAQTIFFITVCFKTQAFDVYLLKNMFLRLQNASDKNGARKS